MKDEILKILKMVEDGKLSSEKAFDMLMIIQEREMQQKKTKGKILKISVDSSNNDTVRVNIPLDFVRNMIKAVGPEYIQKMVSKYIKFDKFSSGQSEGIKSSFDEFTGGLNIDFLLYAVENNFEGEIVNVQSEDAKILIAIE
ncbi:hypothetical protein Calow_0171 [Caldicellulosiruptor owensensis OL]|uniref:YvlB/LiaX N-terminal domain-containing protein n=1 Tax=Caldicellulosiruptor owensensis (strain ATCC 700167 / DSM 13100 / OL) TaxID=632518 RepID=E4Q2M4_CALOW|nr:hypothetical protein [Caldicellulosiruptor owensensis]ADQ03778.1 hypothetical protein Calow_0171 [Caldicellulosiruptor owensensis OL]